MSCGTGGSGCCSAGGAGAGRDCRGAGRSAAGSGAGRSAEAAAASGSAGVGSTVGGWMASTGAAGWMRRRFGRLGTGAAGGGRDGTERGDRGFLDRRSRGRFARLRARRGGGDGRGGAGSRCHCGAGGAEQHATHQVGDLAVDDAELILGF